MCGLDVSSTQVSRAAAQLDEVLEQWRTRPLARYRYVLLDAQYEKVRQGGQVLDAAVLIACGVPWQRCQFHLQQNADQYVTVKAKREEVARDIRSIFNPPDLDEAKHLLEKFVGKYETSMPKLAEWAERNLIEGLTVFSLPQSQRRRLRTTNLVERLNEEIRRRTKVARLFPNEGSCLRLVTAVVMEIAEDWQTAEKRYLTFED